MTHGVPLIDGRSSRVVIDSGKGSVRVCGRDWSVVFDFIARR
jgi:hypothetical protein